MRGRFEGRRVLGGLLALGVLGGLVAGCADEGTDVGTPGHEPAVVPAPPPPGGGPVTPPVGVSSLDGVKLALRTVATVDQPVALAARPGTSSLYVAEKPGRIRHVTVTRSVAGPVSPHRLDPEPALDLTDEVDDTSERGLIGLVFNQDGTELYTFATHLTGTLMIDAWLMGDDRIDAASRRPILRIEHPDPNHNGGQLAFGPDGLLYVAVGDGGGVGDPDENGQDPTTVLGAILRIDPRRTEGERPYGIPEDNPYADGVDGAPEVWTWGLRNPWRFSFDELTGDLWIADVGQASREEINFLPADQGTTTGAGRGLNLGWNQMEGSQIYYHGTEPEDHVPPLFDYGRAGGACSVIGGYVYRGEAWPELQGVYVWADYCVSTLNMLLRRADGQVENRNTGVAAPGKIMSFGRDNDGELYVLSDDGGIHRIVPG
jgi:glucose/arabinose dehydrogenase